MPVHDRYARITPFELLIPEAGFADDRFPLIQAEAEQRGADLSDQGRFPLLSEAGLVLREIRGEGDDPRLIQHHGALLFHAFHFWRQGCPLFLLGTEVARYLLEAGSRAEGWTPSLPAPAGYVQLPQHLFWLGGGEGKPPESLDGFFWSAPGGEEVSLLVGMGIRRDRPGLSVIPLPTLPLSAAGQWASMTVRPDGADFQSSLPGAEVEHLYEVRSGAEAVKLAMRIFWYLDTFPGSVEDGVPGGAQNGEPRPSGLAYRRIILEKG